MKDKDGQIRSICRRWSWPWNHTKSRSKLWKHANQLTINKLAAQRSTASSDTLKPSSKEKVHQAAGRWEKEREKACGGREVAKGEDDKCVKRQTRVISSSNVYWICSITGTHFIGSDYLQHSSGGGNSTESWKEIKKNELIDDQCLRSSSYSQQTLLNCSSLKVVGWRRPEVTDPTLQISYNQFKSGRINEANSTQQLSTL